MSVAYVSFKVTLKDAQGNELILAASKVEWLQGGDSDVRVVAYIGLEEGEALDNWESNKTTLDVSIEPICNDALGNPLDCPQSVRDYLEQTGKASLTWAYNPNGDSEIYLKFEVIE